MLQVITTEDGSPSIYVEDLDETYHSRKGAITESTHIYINAGLKYVLQNTGSEVNIFEMGFGTGLNTILTFAEWQKYTGLTINYTTIEKYPLEKNVIDALIYNGITNGDLADIFVKLHTADWSKKIELANGFTFFKAHADVNNYNIGTNRFNCVYYDAFAPSKQSDVWHLGILQKMYNAIQANGILVTYCANGTFKRNIKQLGFRLEILDGPPGKKEVTRAVKSGF